MHRAVLAALAGVALVVGGCAARERETVSPHGAWGSTDLPGERDLLALLTNRRAALSSIRGIARTSYESRDESHRAKQLLIAARPDRLRLEILSPLGTVFVLATADGRMAAYERGEKTLYRGRATQANLERYAQVDLPITSVVDVLLATPPALSGGSGVVTRDGNLIQLWQRRADDIRVVWFDGQLPARYERRNGQGNVLVRVTYPGYDAVDGVQIPTAVTLEFPPTEQRIGIRLADLEVNPILKDAVFALETPPGTREINLDQISW